MTGSELQKLRRRTGLTLLAFGACLGVEYGFTALASLDALSPSEQAQKAAAAWRERRLARTP